MQTPGGPGDVLAIHVGNQTYTVRQDQVPIIIGREVTAHVCIDDERISRDHVHLDHTSAGWVAIDQSRNGIFIDGTRQHQIPIQDTTTIHLGHPYGIPVTFTEDNCEPHRQPQPETAAENGNAEPTLVVEKTDPNVARVGAAVSARRKELDLPQRYLASNGIMSAGSLIDFEKGRRWPRRATRAKLEEALGWPQGHIARLRNQRIEPDGAQTAALTNTVGMPLMTEVVEVALNNITMTIKSLPATSDPDFTSRANGILADLRRIETSATRAACAATGDSSVVLILGAIRKTYKNLMLHASRAPTATLGQQLFAARHGAELSSAELANAAGVPIEAITTAESEAPLDANTIAALTLTLTSLNLNGHDGSVRTPTKPTTRH